jgi:hypothetical protein
MLWSTKITAHIRILYRLMASYVAATMAVGCLVLPISMHCILSRFPSHLWLGLDLRLARQLCSTCPRWNLSILVELRAVGDPREILLANDDEGIIDAIDRVRTCGCRPRKTPSAVTRGTVCARRCCGRWTVEWDATILFRLTITLPPQTIGAFAVLPQLDGSILGCGGVELVVGRVGNRPDRAVVALVNI